MLTSKENDAVVGIINGLKGMAILTAIAGIIVYVVWNC